MKRGRPEAEVFMLYGEKKRTTIFLPKNLSQYVKIFVSQQNLKTKNNSFTSFVNDLILKEIKLRGFDPARYPEVEILQR
ncbi:MAG: hypothetical protein Q7S84_02255 [bacterium]|nr:hypothetical protein [bacterium]